MVELADLIRDLRDELGRAVAQANQQGLHFQLGPVELETTVAVSKEAKPGAKVRFWVVEAGADASVAKAATQRIKLTLQPQLPGGASAYVSGEAKPTER
ncbi:trypco2 family protein [Fodinicola acaciae]|uniref:trypco2 family protein n=1 Tax=Fodinicola acaciae TaxID=2681555 RepID=UPI0013D1BD8A|nr:trypco2 family protein [Fodinicola acaciae]